LGKRGKVITYEKIKENIKKLGYDLISKEYKNMKSKIIVKDFDGFYYVTEWRKLREKCFPAKFHISNPYTIKNIKLWLNLNNKSFILLSDTYEGCQEKLKCKCLKKECGEKFEITWSCIFTDEGCPYCAGVRVSLSNCLATKCPDMAVEWHPTKNGKLTPWDITINSGKYIWWKCKECGHEWYVKMDSRTNNKTGCPECNKSKGEKKIDEVLIIRNWTKISQKDFNQLIDEDKYNKDYFIPQKEFDGLIGVKGGNLSYDFYIPNLNLLIEYHGGQHEKFTRGIHKTMKDFERQVEHDNRKCEYAYYNKIKLLIIWYWDFDNIEEILDNILF